MSLWLLECIFSLLYILSWNDSLVVTTVLLLKRRILINGDDCQEARWTDHELLLPFLDTKIQNWLLKLYLQDEKKSRPTVCLWKGKLASRLDMEVNEAELTLITEGTWRQIIHHLFHRENERAVVKAAKQGKKQDQWANTGQFSKKKKMFYPVFLRSVNLVRVQKYLSCFKTMLC